MHSCFSSVFSYQYGYLRFIFIFLFISAHSALAQKKLATGYIIISAGDTLHGFINEKGWEVNPKKVQFSTTANADPVTYEVKQLQGFFVESTGDFYKKAIVTIDYTPHKTDEILDVKRLALLESQYIKTDTVFIRELVRGKASLYFLKDRMDKKHFFASKHPKDSLFELTNRVYRIGDQIGYSATYRTQLHGLLNENPEVAGRAKTSSYTGSELSKLFFDYNGTSRQKPLARPASKDLFRLYAITGLALIKPRIMDGYKNMYPPSFNYVASPFIGIGVNTIIPKAGKNSPSIMKSLIKRTKRKLLTNMIMREFNQRGKQSGWKLII